MGFDPADHYTRASRRYAGQRQADPQMGRHILTALGAARSVLNVGAGTGSYEPTDRDVTAVEPCAAMIAQRPADSAPVVQAAAEALPFDEDSFDAAMAVLTIHHWTDPEQGLREMRRVARDRLVLVTWDPQSDGFWLTEEYLPAILEQDRRLFPRLDRIEAALGSIEIIPLRVPAECMDGFLGAYWARPRAYLDPGVRSAMSTFARIPGCDSGLERLRHDLQSGAWERRYGHLTRQESCDLGYRLILCRPAS